MDDETRYDPNAHPVTFAVNSPQIRQKLPFKATPGFKISLRLKQIRCFSIICCLGMSIEW